MLVTCHRWQLTSLSQATNVMSSVTLWGSKVSTLIKHVSTTKLGTGIHLLRTEKVKRKVHVVLLLHSKKLFAVLLLYTSILDVLIF